MGKDNGNSNDGNEKLVFPNKFIRNEIYPKAKGLLQLRSRDLGEIKDTCLFVLDTNVLLFPYTATSNSLGEISKLFKRLKGEKRLALPGQVVREFVSNRPVKLQELHNVLKTKQNPAIFSPFGKYPLFEEDAIYIEIAKIEGEIRDLVKRYTQSVGKLLTIVENWRWNDPISELYSEIFSEDVIVEHVETNEDILNDLKRRLEHKIAPGYKDSSKPDGGIGDLIIWKTILELAKTTKDIIFVTGDDKPDWFYQSQGKGLFERFELVAEFASASGGGTFRMLKLSDLLGLFGVDEKLVEDVRVDEQIVTLSENDGQSVNILSQSERQSIISVLRQAVPTADGFIFNSDSLLIYRNAGQPVPVFCFFSEMRDEGILPSRFRRLFERFLDRPLRHFFFLTRHEEGQLHNWVDQLTRLLQEYRVNTVLHWGLVQEGGYIQLGVRDIQF